MCNISDTFIHTTSHVVSYQAWCTQNVLQSTDSAWFHVDNCLPDSYESNNFAWPYVILCIFPMLWSQNKTFTDKRCTMLKNWNMLFLWQNSIQHIFRTIFGLFMKVCISHGIFIWYACLCTRHPDMHCICILCQYINFMFHFRLFVQSYAWLSSCNKVCGIHIWSTVC